MMSVEYNKYRIHYIDDNVPCSTEDITAFDDQYVINRAKKLDEEGATNVKVIKYVATEIYASEPHTYMASKVVYTIEDKCMHIWTFCKGLTLDEVRQQVKQVKLEDPNANIVVKDEITNKEISLVF